MVELYESAPAAEHRLADGDLTRFCILPTVIGMSEWADATLQHWISRLERGELTPGTAAKYARIFSSFRRFIAAYDVTRPTDVSPEMVRAFVQADAADGTAPAARHFAVPAHSRSGGLPRTNRGR